MINEEFRTRGRAQVRVECQWCGRPFLAYHSHIMAGRGKFCCAEHAKMSLRKPIPYTECQHCGKQFALENRDHRQKFCNRSCFHASRTKRRGLEVRQCKECGKDFEVFVGHKWQMFCSCSCANGHNNRRRGKGPLVLKPVKKKETPVDFFPEDMAAYF